MLSYTKKLVLGIALLCTSTNVQAARSSLTTSSVLVASFIAAHIYVEAGAENIVRVLEQDPSKNASGIKGLWKDLVKRCLLKEKGTLKTKWQFLKIPVKLLSTLSIAVAALLIYDKISDTRISRRHKRPPRTSGRWPACSDFYP